MNDYYYPILSICMGIGAFIILEVGRRLKAAKVLNMAEWASEVEHTMVERVRAGIYVAECDEAIRRLMEKAPVAHGEALLAILDIAKKIEANYAAQIASVMEEPKKEKPQILKRVADVFRPNPGLMPIASTAQTGEQDIPSPLTDSQEITVDFEVPRSEIRVASKPIHSKKRKWLDGQMVG